MVQMWCSILAHFIQDNEQLNRISLNIQWVYYGVISQTLLIEPDSVEWAVLESDALYFVKSLMEI